jgi:hypothetical protein
LIFGDAKGAAPWETNWELRSDAGIDAMIASIEGGGWRRSNEGTDITESRAAAQMLILPRYQAARARAARLAKKSKR